MTLPDTVSTREFLKFKDVSGLPAVRVSIVEGGSGSPAANGFGTIVSGYPTVISVGATSTQLFPANTSRMYARVSNYSNKTIFIEFGSSAVLQEGIRLSPGGVLTLSGSELWLGTVNAITSSGTANISVTEATA